MRHVVAGGRSLLPFLLSLALSCSSLPRDQHGSWQHIQRAHRIRIGVIENPPWTARGSDQPTGAEPELLRRFAAAYGLTPEWHWGGEQAHMEALQRYELDVVIGGLQSDTPWAKTQKIGITKPFFEEEILVGVPPGQSLPSSVNDVQVTAPAADATAGILEKKGAHVSRVSKLTAVRGPVAAPRWQLESWGFTPTKMVIDKRKHVMAVPPGENGLLKRIEDFLHEHQGEVKTLLQTEESAR